ncbi:PREDICTED: uncharacterized protein LOC105559973 [Vollenhovia emeryi]|uniref:uncharacterized protein LOC105559973 n=1 Tax=Vollenhovia emeryi TaxID=411798 RepID=UPI0005F471E3|nr:PREDICTED: uncharacterized protein LOC105559973 [Vollenhovia emeryi]
MAKYSVSQDKYFYTRLWHELVLFAINASIVFATASQLLVFCFHIFGMFKIASNRIEYFIEDSVLHVPYPEKEYAIYKRVMNAVIIHRRAMEFSNTFISTFNVSYCILIFTGVTSLSISLYGFVEAATISKSLSNIVLTLIIILSHLVYMFIANYVGQKITDYSNELFNLTYGTSWYLMPVSSQKLILFLMQKTGKEFCLTVGFIFTAKLETFAMVRDKTKHKKILEFYWNMYFFILIQLVNAAMSYVAVMYGRAN